MTKHEIRLAPKERKRLLSIVTKGVNKAAVIRRAHILLKSNEGKTDHEISELLYVNEDTVRNTRVRFCQEGLEAALHDKSHPPRDTALDAQQEAYLVAMACSDPPAGRERWTMELLAQRLIEDEVVVSISAETVRLVLKKTNLSLGE
jgi:transposase